ncbi:hypothetical protein AC249_AIPGENE15435 [Exaiptasia diaphana]|nr:hypothetical protein AC249_AIPGENE15435 [Exaiptasia diaphana]
MAKGQRSNFRLKRPDTNEKERDTLSEKKITQRLLLPVQVIVLITVKPKGNMKTTILLAVMCLLFAHSLAANIYTIKEEDPQRKGREMKGSVRQPLPNYNEINKRMYNPRLYFQ